MGCDLLSTLVLINFGNNVNGVGSPQGSCDLLSTLVLINFGNNKPVDRGKAA